MSDNGKTAVLFVCLGNICRSPLAEGVFRHLVRTRELSHAYEIDSAGTGGWHVGDPPDARAAAVARRRGVELECAARQVSPGDFGRFDWIVAMDKENLRALEALRGRHGGDAELRLLRDFDPEPGDGEVPDPYYGGPEGFDRVYEMVVRSAEAFLEHLESERSGGR